MPRRSKTPEPDLFSAPPKPPADKPGLPRPTVAAPTRDPHDVLDRLTDQEVLDLAHSKTSRLARARFTICVLSQKMYTEGKRFTLVEGIRRELQATAQVMDDLGSPLTEEDLK